MDKPDSENDGPAERRRVRLAAAIRSRDEAGPVADRFDPWAMCAAWGRLSAAIGQLGDRVRGTDAAREWAAQYDHFRAAEAAYRGPPMASPESQYMAARQCIDLRPRVEAGDGIAVLGCMAHCAAHGLVPPGWLGAEFVSRLELISSGTCADWRDKRVFGKYAAPGETVATIKGREQFGPWGYEVAVGLLEVEPDRSFAPDFWEEVGQRVGRSHSVVAKLVREYVNSEDRPAPLDFVRAGLAKGQSLADVARAWDLERGEREWREFDAQRVQSEAEANKPDSLGN